MATRRKAPQDGPPSREGKVEELEHYQEVVNAPELAEVNDAAVEAFEAHLRSILPIMGKLVPVDCPLEGYEHIRAYFRVNNEYGVAQAFDLLPSGSLLLWKVFPYFVRQLEVITAGDVQPPPGEAELYAALDYDDPATYERLAISASDLVNWLRRGGYKQAKDFKVNFT